MAYSLNMLVDLGQANGNLTDLSVQLVTNAGAATGSPITSFTEVGLGVYVWAPTMIPDGFDGTGLVFRPSDQPPSWVSGNVPLISFPVILSVAVDDTLDAAGIRAAIGMATANLDTQLANIPTGTGGNLID
jgi:hypothetical protein